MSQAIWASSRRVILRPIDCLLHWMGLSTSKSGGVREHITWDTVRKKSSTFGDQMAEMELGLFSVSQHYFLRTAGLQKNNSDVSE